MAEVTQYAYQDLRDYIETNWQYIELQDEADEKVVRLSPADPRVEWTHDTNDQTLAIKVVISGSDADITYPVTFAKSVIFDDETNGDACSVEGFTPFTIESDDDELTVIHSIEVPQVS